MTCFTVFTVAVLVLSSATLSAAPAAPTTKPIEGGVPAARVAAIAALLPEAPFAFGVPIEDRAAWQRLASHPAYKGMVASAEAYVATPIPEMTEDLYMIYWREKRRDPQFDKVRDQRYNRLRVLATAECIENQGRFLKPLEEAIAAACSDRTWFFCNHDGGLLQWNGKEVGIDLSVAQVSETLVTIDRILGDRLSPGTRELIASEMRRRVLDPYRAAVNGSGERWVWWITTESNWNVVCHYGVATVALWYGRDREERAFFLAAAEKYVAHFLHSYGPDGYCAEGMNYWNYGYGNFAPLCELVLQATDGKLDWFEMPGARICGLYPARIQVINGIYPAFADCNYDPRPSPPMMAFVSRHYRLGLKEWDGVDIVNKGAGFPHAMMYALPNSATLAAPASSMTELYELRTYFDHGGVMIGRPARGSDCRMGVALKGGHNAEPHNHNDLGAFVVVLGKEQLVTDPGGEKYNGKTFTPQRYEGELLNSYGHPVPVISGQLQKSGRDAQAKVLQADCTEEADTYALDLRSAYPVPELAKLERTFVYRRSGSGSLTVRDEFAFTSPGTYAGTLITYGKWERSGEHELTISVGDEKVRVRIDTGGEPFDIESKRIEAVTATGIATPTRLGINLTRPAVRGAVTLVIEP